VGDCLLQWHFWVLEYGRLSNEVDVLVLECGRLSVAVAFLGPRVREIV